MTRLEHLYRDYWVAPLYVWGKRSRVMYYDSKAVNHTCCSCVSTRQIMGKWLPFTEPYWKHIRFRILKRYLKVRGINFSSWDKPLHNNSLMGRHCACWDCRMQD